MAPLMGFFHLSVFAGFSIYLPELFPTRLRSTGTSFCYNVGRYLAATGPLTLGAMAANLAKGAQAKAVAAAGPDLTGAALDALKMTAKIDAFRERGLVDVRDLRARPHRPALPARDQGPTAARGSVSRAPTAPD